MNPLLVLVIAAQIGTPKQCMLIQADGKCGLWATDKQTYCYIVRSDDKGTVGKCVEPPSEAPDIHRLPISTRRVEPLVVEPERVVITSDITGTRPLYFDVPAVHVCDVKVKGWQVCPFPDDYPKHTGYHWGCRDPRRVLLTAENGTRHCVLFEGAR